ncbi:MAG: UbiA family prenyltransferase [Theionarchaea archaeon]|nr:UbiA family prenyltransferase [Theionarchaea archaeon]MBU7019463.1 UbiA family prenyltransferase [Theionarchaea archaeon]MBU7035404.1 UbiA family prenyltransferase [Theionarchaea archaeon]MBU7041228.1 UbiA family prenyltransferase [Theionarchaea archaeon]
MKTLLELTRPINDIMSGFAVFIAGVISVGWHMPLLSVVAASLGTFFASAGGMVINDYFDVDIDRVNRPQRPIPSGRITRQGAFYFSLFLFTGAGLCVLFTNAWCVLVGVPALFLIIVYSWKLKRQLFVGNLAVALLSALALLYGGIATGNIQLVSILALVAFFATVSRELAKDIEDIEGDRIGGSQSLPVLLGENVTAQIAGGFLALAIGTSLLPYMLEIFDSLYLILIIPVDLVMGFVMVQMLLKSIEKMPVWQKILKVGMYVTLGIFLVARLI